MAADLAGVALASADGKSTNHYGPKQPAAARLGDTWFRDNGESIEIWIYQLTDTGEPGWVALATDLNHAQVSAELAEARAEVEAAKPLLTMPKLPLPLSVLASPKPKPRSARRAKQPARPKPQHGKLRL